MDLDGFDDPWEHVRLLSDSPRNEVLFELLRRHAPGSVVAELGAGTGLMSLVAARLGAKKVYAIEPSAQWHTAAELVERNGLGHIVEVLPARIEELEPRPVDLLFSELLNADPFAEGLLDAMDAGAAWVKPGGRLAPRRLRLWAALVGAPESADEVERAATMMRQMASTHGLDLDPLIHTLDRLEAYAYLAPTIAPIGPPALLCDVELGAGEEPEDSWWSCSLGSGAGRAASLCGSRRSTPTACRWTTGLRTPATGDTWCRPGR